jgi:hypothetical protein
LAGGPTDLTQRDGLDPALREEGASGVDQCVSRPDGRPHPGLVDVVRRRRPSGGATHVLDPTPGSWREAGDR